MTTCCGRLWRNLGNHLRFAHGEEVVIPERESGETLERIATWGETLLRKRFDTWKHGAEWHAALDEVIAAERLALPCFCGAPAVGWVYQVMSDGQTINGLAVCAAHQEKQL